MQIKKTYTADFILKHRGCKLEHMITGLPGWGKKIYHLREILRAEGVPLEERLWFLAENGGISRDDFFRVGIEWFRRVAHDKPRDGEWADFWKALEITERQNDSETYGELIRTTRLLPPPYTEVRWFLSGVRELLYYTQDGYFQCTTDAILQVTQQRGYVPNERAPVTEEQALKVLLEILLPNPPRNPVAELL